MDSEIQELNLFRETVKPRKFMKGLKNLHFFNLQNCLSLEKQTLVDFSCHDILREVSIDAFVDHIQLLVNRNRKQC